ncbi:hypothetical protein DFA_00449 [Cavenderia fasciculata]|uniref:Phospholipid/glycerol acyltransferase domain-containing protein n=1 Tax=Cavenderia fasciculata TaxID=261658 RepID=F4PRZ0_CACFS|nr:uncharacterized protein DFA_00449 [Cavenderia fasciculata]EGG20588.1 hypothetical protein DFA_00449 [Cavenderia fasciculata]|eukprot:XP_004358438.1 hypothetical protein DFA_00449 [Cavenderia fasciculata]
MDTTVIKRKATDNKEQQPTALSSDTTARKQPSYTKRVDPILYKIIRTIAATIWVISITIMVWFIAPFSAIFVNPILKRMGVRQFYYPLELCSRFWARGLCWIWGIEVVVEGSDLLRKCDGTPTVIMYSHCSNIDPVIMMGYTSIPPRFIFKQELLYFVPLVFYLGYLVGHIPINRKQHHSAVEAINHSAEACRKSKGGVAISPEGTRSVDGQIQDFKKGGFHLAKRANAKIVPACYWGAYEMWPTNNLLPNSGVVHLRFLPAIETSNDDIDELIVKTRRIMKHTLVEEYPKKFNPFPRSPNILNPLIYLGLVAIIVYTVSQSTLYHQLIQTISHQIHRVI